MATVHKWEKYDVATSVDMTVASEYTTIISVRSFFGSSTYIYYGEDYTDVSNECTLLDLFYMSTKPTYVKYDGEVYKYRGITNSSNTVKVTGYKGTLTTNETQGSTSYGQVESEDADAYPENGKHTDGYWYVYIGSEETFDGGVFATIGGVQKQLTSIPAMVDGVQRELSSLLATVDGVAREIFHVSLVIEFVITHLSTTGDGAKQSTTYYAEKGMTFGEWLESEYNTDGFFYNSSLGFICNSSNNAGLFYYPTYDGIPLDEVIESGSEYYLYN